MITIQVNISRNTYLFEHVCVFFMKRRDRMEEIKLKLTKKYISDDFNVCQKVIHILEEKEKILLVAPQGTGKTTFFEKYATD